MFFVIIGNCNKMLRYLGSHLLLRIQCCHCCTTVCIINTIMFSSISSDGKPGPGFTIIATHYFLQRSDSWCVMATLYNRLVSEEK